MLKRRKYTEKEAGIGPFLKKVFVRFLNAVNGTAYCTTRVAARTSNHYKS